MLNPTTVSGIVGQMGSLKVTRLIVTDQRSRALYDSSNQNLGDYVLLPEILKALETDDAAPRGNDVFSWNYHDGIMDSRAATPIVSYGLLLSRHGTDMDQG